ncbi:MAG: glycosyltransferase family 4 protein [Propionibacteriaceae bacterium]|jgi:glycosyltransferase involved in cell wall biosynthesis|nr:glycosyltransferase family 4 protein [Propionibacteriaceae bacterium]
MDIAVDARNIGAPAGIGRYSRRLLENLEAIDPDNNYLVLTGVRWPTDWRPTSPKWTVEAVDFPDYSWAEQTGLGKYLRAAGPDLTHFLMPQQPVGFHGPKVTTVHDFTMLRPGGGLRRGVKRMLGGFVFKRAIADSRAVIAISEYTKGQAIAFAPAAADRVRVVYEAADDVSTDVEPCQVPFDDYLVYVGAHYEHKNLLRLVDAHQELLAACPGLGLVFVGAAGPVERTQDHVAATRARNTHFTGVVPDAQRNWLYQHARLAVMPSLAEGFGLPGLEAMIHRAPLASSNATCLPEIYGDAPVYFDPLDTAAMATAIGSVLHDEASRAAMIARGLARAAEFSWRRCAEETLAVYMG